MDSYIANESAEILKHKETLLKERGINPYKTLGISKKSSRSELKKAYDKICLEIDKSIENSIYIKGNKVTLEEIEYAYDYIFFRLFSEKYRSKTETNISRNVNSMNDAKIRNEILYGIEDEESKKMEKEIKKFQDAENTPLQSMLDKFKGSSGDMVPINAPDHKKFISPKTKKFNVKKFMESFEDYSKENADTLLREIDDTGSFKAMESYCEGTVKGMNIKYCDGMIIPTKEIDDVPGELGIRKVINIIPENYIHSKTEGNKKRSKQNTSSLKSDPLDNADIKAAFASKKKELENPVFIERKSYAQAEHEMLQFRKKMNEKDRKNMKENIGRHFGLF